MTFLNDRSPRKSCKICGRGLMRTNISGFCKVHVNLPIPKMEKPVRPGVRQVTVLASQTSAIEGAYATVSVSKEPWT